MSISNQKEWLCLVSYGDHPFQEGTQCFHYASAIKLVNEFNSLWKRFLRGFKGLPIYKGHPDVPEFRKYKEHKDSFVYGRILELEAREEALWAKIKWEKKALKYLNFSKYAYFSPYWVLKIQEGNRYTPICLISVGLTDQPNIPGPSITNQRFDFLQPTFKPAFSLKTKSETFGLRSLMSSESFSTSKSAFLKSVQASLRPDLEPYATAWSREKRKYKDHYPWGLS